MVQFGPADYSMSLGLTGQRDHPSVVEAEAYVIKTALDKGIQPRAEINDPEQAKKYLDMGVRHFCIGTDVTILFDWFKEKGSSLRNLISDA
jgi:4-hydroxy-2-oxoheptanedioate aldolase